MRTPHSSKEPDQPHTYPHITVENRPVSVGLYKVL